MSDVLRDPHITIIYPIKFRQFKIIYDCQLSKMIPSLAVGIPPTFARPLSLRDLIAEQKRSIVLVKLSDCTFQCLYNIEQNVVPNQAHSPCRGTLNPQLPPNSTVIYHCSLPITCPAITWTCTPWAGQVTCPDLPALPALTCQQVRSLMKMLLFVNNQ